MTKKLQGKKPQKFTQSEVERLIRAARAQGLVVDAVVHDADGIRLVTRDADHKVPIKPDAVRR